MKSFSKVVLLAVIVFSSTTIWAAQSSVKVGLLVPLTGIAPVLGEKQVVGMEMALEKINMRGGVNGMPVEVIKYDTGGHPQKLEQAKAQYIKLANDDKVLVTIGPFYSFECQALFPLTNNVKVAVIATASSKPGLSDLNKSPYAFRMTVTEDKMAAAQFKRWMEVYGIKTVAIVYDKKDPTASVMGTKIWPMVLKKLDITILNEKEPITYVTGENGFEDHVKKVKAINPDGICISGYHRDAGNFAKEVRKQGLKQPLIGQNQSLGPVFIEAAGKAAEDFWSVGLFYVDDPNPKVKAYAKEFKERCQKRYTDMICDPEQYDVVVHDILHFLVDIMKKKGISNDPARLQEDRDKIRTGLANMKIWRGTAGMMTFDKKGDGIRTIHILRVKDGKWQPVQ